MFSFTASQKHIELLFECKLENDIIYNDARRLQQVLINFVSNSLKFTAKGYISILVEADERDAQCIAISIVDTGCGIPKKI
jgi:signal transduction histidine kinase